MDYWKDKQVVVTGGAGFLGTHLVNLLKTKNPRSIIIPRSSVYDLREKEAVKEVVKDADIVIHLAAIVGGIGYNQKIPGSMYYDNILMGTHLIEESRKAGVKKFVAIGTVCAYPKFAPIPFSEDSLWDGYPEETNASYGLAKKMLLVQSQAYRAQYGFNSIFLLPVNLYGPGDNFDPTTSHVIPALIKKFVDAKKNKEKFVTVWGTGNATREFLYVEDAARGILLATENYNEPDPVNLGSHFEISIRDLSKIIKKKVGYTGDIVFDTTKPDGQPRRKLDTSRALKEFGFSAEIDFDEGLERTISWYKSQSER